MTLRYIYDAGYRDGEHDGYNSTIIENGVEESHYGKSLEFDMMTNGDVIEMLFSNYSIRRNDFEDVPYDLIIMVKGTAVVGFDKDWWDIPYRKE